MSDRKKKFLTAKHPRELSLLPNFYEPPPPSSSPYSLTFPQTPPKRVLRTETRLLPGTSRLRSGCFGVPIPLIFNRPVPPLFATPETFNGAYFQRFQGGVFPVSPVRFDSFPPPTLRHFQKKRQLLPQRFVVSKSFSHEVNFAPRLGIRKKSFPAGLFYTSFLSCFEICFFSGSLSQHTLETTRTLLSSFLSLDSLKLSLSYEFSWRPLGEGWWVFFSFPY